MKNTIRLTLACTLISVLLVGTQARAEEGEGGNDTMRVARGAKSWSNNCGQCHNARDPAEMSDDQWGVVVTHMRIRANLTGEETRDILAFLQASN